MKLFEKFRSKSSKPHSARFAELREAKVRLASERAEIEAKLASREERREAMLADDKPEREILALDSECDALHVKLEKLNAQLRFVDAEIAKTIDSQTLEQWRAVNERRLEAARRYAGVLATVQEAYIDFCEARNETLEPKFSSLYYPVCGVPTPPSPPQLEIFKRGIEACQDFEAERKATAIELAMQS